MLTSLVPYAGHGIAGERLKYGVGLDVWHEDDCMPMEVLCKGIAFPATMCFDNVEGSPRRRYSSVALIRKRGLSSRRDWVTWLWRLVCASGMTWSRVGGCSRVCRQIDGCPWVVDANVVF